VAAAGKSGPAPTVGLEQRFHCDRQAGGGLGEFGCLRTYSLFEAVCVLFTSSVAINRSSSSRVLSTDLLSSCWNVASSAASRRPSGCRRISEASALIPSLASSRCSHDGSPYGRKDMQCAGTALEVGLPSVR
jgi:hypothetical protein